MEEIQTKSLSSFLQAFASKSPGSKPASILLRKKQNGSKKRHFRVLFVVATFQVGHRLLVRVFQLVCTSVSTFLDIQFEEIITPLTPLPANPLLPFTSEKRVGAPATICFAHASPRRPGRHCQCRGILHSQTDKSKSILGRNKPLSTTTSANSHDIVSQNQPYLTAPRCFNKS